MIYLKFVFLLVVLFGGVYSETIEELNSIILKYETSFNASRVLNRDDRKLVKKWSEEFQIKRLEVSLKYRMQMIKHMEHSFKSEGNLKWISCVHNNRKQIRDTKKFYHDGERECLRAAATADAEKIRNVEQLEKEIVKWRKGYKYLVNSCKSDHHDDENAKKCLVEKMQNDNYDQVVQRLMILKFKAMDNLYAYYNGTLIDLEECLKTLLSEFLERIRSIMSILFTCYNVDE